MRKCEALPSLARWINVERSGLPVIHVCVRDFLEISRSREREMPHREINRDQLRICLCLFRADERGVTAIEYGLIAASTALVIAGLMGSMSDGIAGKFKSVVDSIAASL
jgi:pilus assembly protein Flp/PilA